MKNWFDKTAVRGTWYLYNRLMGNVRRNMPYELVWREAAETSARFIKDNLADAVLYQNRMDFWRFILTRILADGALFEVGVFQGVSINFIADTLAKRGDSRLVHGFDSFEGLEEDWTGEGLKEGYFDQGGKLPDVRPNVRLHKGWVQETMGPYLEVEGHPKIALLHIDTDTYTPARYTLETARPALTEGSIIVFDELIGYPNWQAHEMKALTECLKREDYSYIGFTSRQAAIRMLRAPG